MVTNTLGLLALFTMQAVADLFPDCVNGPLAKILVCHGLAPVAARAQTLIGAPHSDEKFNLTVNTRRRQHPDRKV